MKVTQKGKYVFSVMILEIILGHIQVMKIQTQMRMSKKQKQTSKRPQKQNVKMTLNL